LLNVLMFVPQDESGAEHIRCPRFGGCLADQRCAVGVTLLLSLARAGVVNDLRCAITPANGKDIEIAMSDEDTATTMDRILNKLRDASRAGMLRSTIPIFVARDGGIPIAHGSGVLLAIDSYHFLLSCAHV
jgi:hypothetical protein